MDVQLHSFLTLALDENEWTCPWPGCFGPGKMTTGTHRIGDQVAPRAGLNFSEENNLLSLLVMECCTVQTVA